MPSFEAKSGQRYTSDIQPNKPQTEDQKLANLDGNGRTLDPELVPSAVGEYLSAHLKLTPEQTGHAIREIFMKPISRDMVERTGVGQVWKRVDAYIGKQYANRDRAANGVSNARVLHNDTTGKTLPAPAKSPQDELREAGLGDAVDRKMAPWTQAGSVAQRAFRARLADSDHGFNYYGVPSKMRNDLTHELLGIEHLADCQLTEEEAFQTVMSGLAARFDKVTRPNTGETEMTKPAAPAKPAVDQAKADEAQLRGQWKAWLDNHAIDRETMLAVLNEHLALHEEPAIAGVTEWQYSLDDASDVLADWRTNLDADSTYPGASTDDEPPAALSMDTIGAPAHGEAVATCYPTEAVVYKGYRFNFSLRSGGSLRDFLALADQFIAADKQGLIKLTPAATKPVAQNNANQGQGGASKPTGAPTTPKPAAQNGGGQGERKSVDFYRVTRNSVNGKTSFSLDTLYNGKPSTKPPQGVTKERDVEVFMKALATKWGEEFVDTLELGKAYDITGTNFWTPGNETAPGSGKYWHNDVSYVFNDLE